MCCLPTEWYSNWCTLGAIVQPIYGANLSGMIEKVLFRFSTQTKYWFEIYFQSIKAALLVEVDLTTD